MKTDFEIREIALALMGGGWSSDDRELFVEENSKQDEENILTAEEIDLIFQEIEREEKENGGMRS